MKRKTARLIINPRSGKNVARLTDIIAVLSAAGWKPDTALKEFGGHAIRLARGAAEAGYDLVIGYGGDGTLNQIVNGVMRVKRRRTIVGVIPGGTANVWAHEIGIPEDPVKASLLLVNSEGRKVDLGHVEVERQGRERKSRPASRGRHHFLLMAGLGLDAAVLDRVSTPLKERLGAVAVALVAAKELPSQHAFPIEIRASDAGRADGVLWKGEAVQVIVGNTRRYGNIAEVTPEAHIDDGMLDVCVITAGDPLTTIEQVLSTLLHREPVHGRSEYFQGAHFRISVPATVGLQLDGSRVKLKDYLAAPDRAALRRAENPASVLLTYRFDALPRALCLAIPRTYDNALFEAGSADDQPRVAEQQHQDAAAVQSPEQIDALLEHGRKVTVVGVGPNPERKATYIVAGTSSDGNAGEAKPVAVRIDRETTLVRRTGEQLSVAFAAELPEGGVIVVEGKPSKRGVIRAKRVVVG